MLSVEIYLQLHTAVIRSVCLSANVSAGLLHIQQSPGTEFFSAKGTVIYRKTIPSTMIHGYISRSVVLLSLFFGVSANVKFEQSSTLFLLEGEFGLISKMQISLSV